MNKLYQLIVSKLECLRDIPPLAFRLILAYGFYEPALNKWNNIDNVAKWFASMNYPFPKLNVYLAASTEAAGVILLALGFATRLISAPLMFVMIIAITTVHLDNGFSCGKNGFEIPFYYFFMLLSLLISGPGKISLDAAIKRKYNSTE